MKLLIQTLIKEEYKLIVAFYCLDGFVIHFGVVIVFDLFWLAEFETPYCFNDELCEMRSSWVSHSRPGLTPFNG